MTDDELLAAFDLFNLIFITILLVITWPLAIFVYAKLIFCPPYSISYTFKLIVVNGVTELLCCTTFLVNYQIATFAFARPLIVLLQDKKFGYPMKAFDIMTNGIGQHTAFFVALNRLTTITSITRKGSDALFFYASIIISTLLSSLKILNLFVFSNQYYMETDFGAGPIFIPRVEVYSEIYRTILDAENAVVACSTLVLNVALAVFLARRQLSVDKAENRRRVSSFKAERGLIITSFVSYLFYALFFVNSIVARYFDVTLCGYAQFLFLGLASVTPFWCLMIFASSIRRALIILWMLSQVIMNVSIIFYSMIFMFIEHESVPEFIHLPGHRRMYVENSLRFYYVSCFFEFGISFERVEQGLAQLKHVYFLKISNSGFSRVLMTMNIVIFHIEPPLAPDDKIDVFELCQTQPDLLDSLANSLIFISSHISVETAKLLYGSLISHFITEGPDTLQCAIGTVVSNVVDIGAFYMNIRVYFNCKRRNHIVEDTTLNGRYQIKEVYAITRAMLPVYCIGSVVKIPVATITWLFLFDVVNYAWSEIVCTVACVSSCGVTSALFMRFHSVIRGRVARIFKRTYRDAEQQSSVVVPQTAEETTSAYFRIINGMWE
ncbi:hypothetical protein PRIPAC_80129 [Pristionchus pacificus]|uniref:Uncharacterized protein n=1 Tax=Pristionchus pacificus TaxID=54126 RepID=A0A2A6CPQ5_PRIPA|nr:hypothetical protein PRIPAC_80129 [Pristionchus pacificus]|eukprot:PDM80100.1 hypothetical protein PRIPAC_32679 [Pristionchus pacificus]